ncbi:MAG: hypothetical protein E6Q98_06130 [Rhodospirillaceae bacterium]|nr:MAG: hypothetical protein E6Q98_06130 [Rhodospirillaceae bacterium]
MLPDRAVETKDSSAPPTPSSAEIRQYLGTLLRQGTFQTSERNRRFLSYVVEETLEGRADRIKAYNIALAAFDRTEDFDPMTDPIVRIEASRLRRSLEHYYLTDGQADCIRIAIPKGSYAATFGYKEGAIPETPPPPQTCVSPTPSSPRLGGISGFSLGLCALAVMVCVIIGYSGLKYGVGSRSGASQDTPSLAIASFEDNSGDPKYSFIARSLTYDVATALTQLPGVAIFGLEPSESYAPAQSQRRPNYVLRGSVHVEEHDMRVAVFLLDANTGQFLQSWYIKQNMSTNTVIGMQAAIAQQILASVKNDCASPLGNLRTQGRTVVFECEKPAVDVARQNAKIGHAGKRS